MASQLQGSPRFLALDANGNPRVGAKLFTYSEGTSTKKFVYQDKLLAVAHTNPVILDSNGEATIWLNGAYKWILAPANDTDPPTSPIWTIDNIGSASTVDYVIGDEPVNKSFELNTANAALPDFWTLAGAGTWELGSTAAHTNRGSKYIKLSDNVGTATSSFFEVTPDVVYNVTHAVKTGAVGPSNPGVDVLYYDDAFVLLATVTLPGIISSLATSWVNKSSYFIPGSTARYAKLQFNISALSAGQTVYIDALEVTSLDWAQAPVRAGAGSATAPIYTTKDDSNTGIYFPAADTLAISTSGTARVWIGSDGRVNLGGLTSTAGAGTETPNVLRITGQGIPALTGSGLELGYNTSGYSHILSYNRTSGLYEDMLLDCDIFSITNQGNFAAVIGSSSYVSPVHSSFKALQIGSAGFIMANKTANGTYVCNDMYYDGSWKLKSGTAALYMSMEFNGLTVYTAPAGAANSVAAAVQRFIVTLSGNVIVGASDNAVITSSGVFSSTYAPGSVQGGLHTFIESENGGHATEFTISSSIGAAWESVGPTGSGATNTWTAMDIIPTGAKAAILKMQIFVRGGDTGIIYTVKLYARRTGAVSGLGVRTLIANAQMVNRSGAFEDNVNATTCIVPIDTSRRLDMYVETAGSSITISIIAALVGYIM